MKSESITIVISQPFFFPWVGLFEQIVLADTFVHYDDVQFTKGGFINRVQIKTQDGFKWLTVPLKGLKLKQNINEVEVDFKKDWRKSHLEFLKQTYKNAPYVNDMLGVVEQVYFHMQFNNLAEFIINGISSCLDYYDLTKDTIILSSSQLNIGGKSTERVLGIVSYLKGEKYITGLGALKYFDFDLFEANGIRVYFMDYQKQPYKQLYGAFNPYVSILDLIANTGKEGRQMMCSKAVYWKEFIKSETAKKYLERGSL